MKWQNVFVIVTLFSVVAACQSEGTKQPPAEPAASQKAPTGIYERMSNEAFKSKLAATTNPQLVDVRTPEENAAGNIEGSVLINFYDPDFQQQVVQKLDKNRPVFLYCRSGNRSQKVAKIMQEAGFGEIYELQGGYSGWTE
jgi:rhodanese-related sulfurtransferase